MEKRVVSVAVLVPARALHEARQRGLIMIAMIPSPTLQSPGRLSSKP